MTNKSTESGGRVKSRVISSTQIYMLICNIRHLATYLGRSVPWLALLHLALSMTYHHGNRNANVSIRHFLSLIIGASR